MKAALLCNGPSRVAFQGRTEYDYVIGCNIPWFDVDATVILDIEVVRKWDKDLNLISCPVFFSEHAWRETHNTKRARFLPQFNGLVNQEKEFDSSGHVAARKLIELGYKTIDIYGCDSYFTDVIDSYTHQYVANISPQLTKQMAGWRNRWDKLIKDNPEVSINFIGEPK